MREHRHMGAVALIGPASLLDADWPAAPPPPLPDWPVMPAPLEALLVGVAGSGIVENDAFWDEKYSVFWKHNTDAFFSSQLKPYSPGGFSNPPRNVSQTSVSFSKK